MGANEADDSLECRNCHSAIAMDFTKQTNRAAAIHTKYLISKQRTCIDCHKGIAHELPDMTGVEPGWSRHPKTLTAKAHLRISVATQGRSRCRTTRPLQSAKSNPRTMTPVGIGHRPRRAMAITRSRR